MKVGKGKITRKKSGGGKYDSAWIYIPSKIFKDKSFPFGDKSEVIIEIKDEKLIISRSYNLYKIMERYEIDDATLPKLLENKAKKNKNKIFLYFLNESYSYEDLNKYSNQIAYGILRIIEELNLKNPKIALLMSNCPDFFFCWFGSIKAGCIFVSVPNILYDNLLEYILSTSGTEILIIDYQFLQNFEEIQHNIPKVKKIIVRNAPKSFKFNNFYIDFQELITLKFENPEIDIKNWHPMEICFTEGTTGKPKAVLYRNYYVMSGISTGNELQQLGFNQTHKIYCPLPLYLIFSRYLVIFTVIFYDASIIITNSFDVSNYWEDIKKYKATAICYLGVILSELINQPSKITDRNHSIKWAFGIGNLKRWGEIFEKRFGIPIYAGWAFVEGVGITINKIGSRGNKLGSIGKAMRGFEFKIVDKNEKELPLGSNHIGEIACRTILPFELEYYRNTLENVTRISKNRWVLTGDYGYKDNDDFIYFLGRQSDIILKNKEPIFAIDIEEIANNHPNVVESAVFGVPNEEKLEEDIKLCIVLKNKQTITHEEFSNYLFQNMAYYLVPKYIEFKDQFPKNGNGLIKKFILRKEWESENSKRNSWDTEKKNFILTD